MMVMDRYLGRRLVVRWIQLLILGTALMVVGDALPMTGYLLKVFSEGRGLAVLEYYGLRLPDLLGLWLPLAPLVATMLTAGPLHRDGGLTALRSAGISPARIFASGVVLAGFSGVLVWMLHDRISPSLSDRVEAAAARMDGKLSGGNQARASGWRSGNTYWNSSTGYPAAGTLWRIIIRAQDDNRCWLADSLTWTPGSGWAMTNVFASTADGNLTFIANTTPAALGLTPPVPPESLAVLVRPVRNIPGPDLPLDRREGLGAFCSRILMGLLPLSILGWGFPSFLSGLGRGHPALAGIRAVMLAGIPMLVVFLTSTLVTASRLPVLILASLATTLVMGPAIWRWWRMGR